MTHIETTIDFASASDNDIKEFGRNIVRDNIVVVRNQELDESRILHICETIGNVLKPKQFFMHPEHPGLFRVTNERKHGEKIGIFADNELDWHSNGNGRPSGKESCVALYCVKPGKNSVTSFCDTRQAYNELPDDVKEIVTSEKGCSCGTGDSFVNQHIDMQVDVVDMEAYAIAKVCKLENIEFKCFKYISDNADENADNDWNKNLALGATAFTSLINTQF